MPLINKPSDEATELIKHRTPDSKRFILPDGRVQIVSRIGLAHYEDENGKLQDIDTTVSLSDQDDPKMVVEEAPYKFALSREGVGYDIEFRSGGTIRVQLVQVGEQDIDTKAFFIAEREGSQITFKSVADDLDILVRLHPTRIAVFRRLNSAKAARSWRWMVTCDKLIAENVGDDIWGTDDAGKDLLGLSLVKEKEAENGDGAVTYFCRESWDGTIIASREPETRNPIPGEPQYPVMIDPDVDLFIAAGADDGSQYAGGTWVSAFSGYFVRAGFYGAKVHGAWRWPLAIPQGSVISSAEFKYNVTSVVNGGAAGKIYAFAEDNSGACSTGDGPVNRSKTTAYTSVAKSAATGIQTVDVTAVVQEIVDRAGFVSGNYIGLVFMSDETTAARLNIEDYGNSGTTPGEIVVTLSNPATEVNLTGPSSGVGGAASTNFTVQPDGDAPGVTVTPHTNGTGTFSPTSVTFTSSESKTFTYTPDATTTSPHTISITASDGALTVTDTISYAFVAETTQAGNWATGSTWIGGAVPHVNLAKNIKHNVSVTADTTVGSGANSTFLTVTTGKVTVTGVALTIRGNSLWGQAGSSSAHLVVEPNGSTQGGVELDGNSGVTPIMYAADDSLFNFLGTSGGRVFLRTKSGTAGNSGRVISNGIITDGLQVDAQYCDFSQLGTSSIEAIYSAYENSGTCSYQYCTIDDCGKVVARIDNAGTLQVKYCQVTNTRDTGNTGIDIRGIGSIGAGTRDVIGNNFHCSVSLYYYTSITVRHNNFFEYIHGQVAAGTSWIFDGNFVYKSVTVESLMSGGGTNSFWLINDGTSAAGHLQQVDQLWENNCFQRVVTGDVYAALLAMTEHATLDWDVTVRNNVALMSSDGGGSGCLIQAFHNSLLGSNPYLTAQHNTILLGSGDRAFGIWAIGTYDVDEFVKCESNLAVRVSGVVTGTYLTRIASDPTPVTDALSAANADYNGYFGLATVPADTFSAISGDTGVEDGTPYSTPMSGATSPGVHDVVEEDPDFFDGTRTIETWAVSLGSLGATQADKRADAFTYLASDPETMIPALVNYCRAGLRPRNLAYKDAGHDSVTIGAMEYEAPAASGRTGMNNRTLRPY